MNQQGNKFEATEDAKWVKLIYQWYLAGVSTNEIARRLEFLSSKAERTAESQIT